MNSYKVVLTIEKGAVCFSAVPHGWEINGKLYWPDHVSGKTLNSLRLDSASVPAINWHTYDCRLKYSNILTYEEAREIEKKFSKCEDTDAEESIHNSAFANKRQVIPSAKAQQNYGIDRNHLITLSVLNDDITNDASSVHILSNDICENVLSTPEINETSDEYLQNNENFIANEHNDTNCDEQFHQIIGTVNQMQCENKEMFNIIKQTNENYIKIMTYLDKIYSVVATQQPSQIQREHPQDMCAKNKVESLRQHFTFPLSTAEELQKFDNEIMTNLDFKNAIVAEFSLKFGSSGDKDATKFKYNIIDCFLTRKLLTQLTWTGICKTKKNLHSDNEHGKQPFHIFKGMHTVIFQLFHRIDTRHTMTKNDAYLKEAVRHATKRFVRDSNKAAIKPADAQVISALQEYDVSCERVEPNVDNRDVISTDIDITNAISDFCI